MTGTSLIVGNATKMVQGEWHKGKSAKKCLLLGGGSYCCHYLMIQATLLSG